MVTRHFEVTRWHIGVTCAPPLLQYVSDNTERLSEREPMMDLQTIKIINMATDSMSGFPSRADVERKIAAELTEDRGRSGAVSTLEEEAIVNAMRKELEDEHDSHMQSVLQENDDRH